ncbi:prolipoprotein diacylglyceryltransferase [Granulicella mallensis]|uniref:Prolipoprotein diacylglyceryltransferase n=1 Tax=Granulicella mallensis TaxID=940614 RepID=A0A7W7ZLS3_9BACT|nr:prolipoprotein diacylglyceryltransferase [Granulicella mallensis]
MSIFSKLLAVLKGAQSFPQPFRRTVSILFFLSCVAPTFLIAQTGGRIAGAVKDATGGRLNSLPHSSKPPERRKT